MEPILKLLNSLCVTKFILLRNKDKQHVSKLWIESSDDSKRYLMDVGMTEDDIAANTEEHGINIMSFMLEHNIIYIPEFGFQVIPDVKD